MFGTDPQSMLTLVTVAIFLCVVLAVGSVLMGAVGKGSLNARRSARRVDALRRRGMGITIMPGSTAAASIKIAEASSSIPGLEQIAKKLMPRKSILTERLARTGRSISLGMYGAICVILGTAVGVVQVNIFHFPLAISILAGVAAGIGLPHVVISNMIARRTRQFLALFPEAIELIVRGLKSGMPVTEEIAVVGRELADPVGIEFRKISDALRFGQTMEQALWATAGRLGIPDFNFFVISLSVQRETGGNLAETLENLADILRKRRQMKLKIKAMSSEARASAMIIGALPFAMLGILLLLSPSYMSTLFTDLRGNVMGGFALFLQGVGAFIMAKMVRFEI